jgi:hypothetical protein
MRALFAADFCFSVGLQHVFLEGGALQVVNAVTSRGYPRGAYFVFLLADWPCQTGV